MSNGTDQAFSSAATGWKASFSDATTWLAGSSHFSITSSTRYGFSAWNFAGCCPGAETAPHRKARIRSDQPERSGMAQAVRKILRLYIQYRMSHSTAKTAIAWNSVVNEPSVPASGVVKIATVLLHGMMLSDI